MCCMYLRDMNMAEDAVQETFLKAYNALSSFRGDSSEKTWLYRIAVNVCNDMRRNAWYRFIDKRIDLDRLQIPVEAQKRGKPCADDGDHAASPQVDGGRLAVLL